MEEVQRFEADPIHSAGLFEGDIDNVSMDDLRTMRTGEFGKVRPNNQSFRAEAELFGLELAKTTKNMKKYAAN